MEPRTAQKPDTEEQAWRFTVSWNSYHPTAMGELIARCQPDIQGFVVRDQNINEALYNLLADAFNIRGLMVLTGLLFPTVYRDVGGHSVSKDYLLMQIISYLTSNQQTELIELLAYVKEKNPYQYDHHLSGINSRDLSRTANPENTRKGDINMNVSISPEQQLQLQEALLSAYPARQKLEPMVLLKLGENLATIVRDGATYDVAIYDLIRWAVSQGRVVDLVVAASGPPPGVPRNPKLLEFKEQFFSQVSQQVFVQAPAAGAPRGVGPDIQWQGPTDDLVLQSWLRRAPDLLDVGFLQRALKQVMSVCRIEIPSIKSQGTGFLIAPTLLLTNYHVLKPNDSANIEVSAREAELFFGDFSKETAGRGQKFKLEKTKPLLGQSPTDKLDYVLLQVEEAIKDVEDIGPVAWDANAQLDQGQEINILQHPEGQTMKIAVSSDGITGVYPTSGRVQYVTTAKEGSSGSPCFNDEWKVIALHHAERSKPFGSIREGILFSAIYPEIKQYL